MGGYVLRRLVQAVFTVLGVMLLTFVLFRLVTGDVTAQFVSPKLGKEARVAWLRRNHLDLPMVLNLQRRLVFTDRTRGEGRFTAGDATGSRAAAAMLLERSDKGPGRADAGARVVSVPVQLLSLDDPLGRLTGGDPWVAGHKRGGGGDRDKDKDKDEDEDEDEEEDEEERAPGPAVVFTLRDGSELAVDLSPLADPNAPDRPAPGATVGDLVGRIDGDPNNAGRLGVEIGPIDRGRLFDSQFLWHLWESVTFSNRSYKTDELLLDVIAKKARYSLAISVPLLALGWLFAMVVSSVVAYYRASLIDKLGVFVCVLGMCVPFLVYMIIGQKIVFEIAPMAAWGIHNPANVYVPVAIAMIAGLGRSVRFYRTVILDQVKQDYVRTARAKGVPLYGILFRHVLRNCMLPILTSLVLSIPFLIMGSLLLERFFGVPGLGDLMVSSVSDRDVPVISGLTFLTAAVYVVGLLITDVLYAVFDPRIRLR